MHPAHPQQRQICSDGLRAAANAHPPRHEWKKPSELPSPELRHVCQPLVTIWLGLKPPHANPDFIKHGLKQTEAPAPTLSLIFFNILNETDILTAEDHSAVTRIRRDRLKITENMEQVAKNTEPHSRRVMVSEEATYRHWGPPCLRSWSG